MENSLTETHPVQFHNRTARDGGFLVGIASNFTGEVHGIPPKNLYLRMKFTKLAYKYEQTSTQRLDNCGETVVIPGICNAYHRYAGISLLD